MVASFEKEMDFEKIQMESDPAKKLRLCAEFLKKHPSSSYKKRIFYRKFRHFIEQAKVTEDSLIAAFKQFSALAPKEFDAYNRLCDYYLNEQKDYDKTIKYAKLGFENVNKYWKGFLAEYEA